MTELPRKPLSLMGAPNPVRIAADNPTKPSFSSMFNEAKSKPPNNPLNNPSSFASRQPSTGPGGTNVPRNRLQPGTTGNLSTSIPNQGTPGTRTTGMSLQVPQPQGPKLNDPIIPPNKPTEWNVQKPNPWPTTHPVPSLSQSNQPNTSNPSNQPPPIIPYQPPQNPFTPQHSSIQQNPYMTTNPQNTSGPQNPYMNNTQPQNPFLTNTPNQAQAMLQLIQQRMIDLVTQNEWHQLLVLATSIVAMGPQFDPQLHQLSMEAIDVCKSKGATLEGMMSQVSDMCEIPLQQENTVVKQQVSDYGKKAKAMLSKLQSTSGWTPELTREYEETFFLDENGQQQLKLAKKANVRDKTTSMNIINERKDAMIDSMHNHLKDKPDTEIAKELGISHALYMIMRKSYSLFETIRNFYNAHPYFFIFGVMVVRFATLLACTTQQTSVSAAAANIAAYYTVQAMSVLLPIILVGCVTIATVATVFGALTASIGTTVVVQKILTSNWMTRSMLHWAGGASILYNLGYIVRDVYRIAKGGCYDQYNEFFHDIMTSETVRWFFGYVGYLFCKVMSWLGIASDVTCALISTMTVDLGTASIGTLVNSSGYWPAFLTTTTKFAATAASGGTWYSMIGTVMSKLPGIGSMFG